MSDRFTRVNCIRICQGDDPGNKAESLLNCNAAPPDMTEEIIAARTALDAIAGPMNEKIRARQEACQHGHTCKRGYAALNMVIENQCFDCGKWLDV